MKPGLILVYSCISCLPIFAQLLVIINRFLPTGFQGNSKSPSLHLKRTLRSYHSNVRALLVQASGNSTNRSSKETFQRHAKQSGAVEACWAHNPEVRGSKPRSAIFIFISKKMRYFPPKSGENADRTCGNSRIFVILGIPRIFRL